MAKNVKPRKRAKIAEGSNVWYYNQDGTLHSAWVQFILFDMVHLSKEKNDDETFAIPAHYVAATRLGCIRKCMKSLQAIAVKFTDRVENINTKIEELKGMQKQT